MPAEPILVGVPSSDAEALTQLLCTWPDEQARAVKQNSLDGVETAAGILTVTLASLHLLEAWLLARVKRNEGSTVRIRGVVMHGYSADEIDVLVSRLKDLLSDPPQSPELNDSDPCV